MFSFVVWCRYGRDFVPNVCLAPLPSGRVSSRKKSIEEKHTSLDEDFDELSDSESETSSG